MASRRVAVVSILAVAAACSSSYGTEEPATPPSDDGGASDASVVDAVGNGDAGVVEDADAASEAGMTCATTDPFTDVNPIGLGGSNLQISDIRLGLDEKYAIFRRHSIDAGTDASVVSDIYTASRSSPTAGFGGPNAIDELATSATLTAPTLSPNLLTVVYAQYAGEGSGWDLIAETRATKAAPFSGASLPNVNAGSNTTDFYPYLSHDGSMLYFASSRSSTNSLFRVTFGTGAAPENIPRMDKQGSDFAPVLTGDGLTLYFARAPAGELSNTAAPSLIYVQHRNTTAEDFGPATVVTEANVISSRNLPSWISPDACRLYITSSRGGKLDVYVATRSPK